MTELCRDLMPRMEEAIQDYDTFCQSNSVDENKENVRELTSLRGTEGHGSESLSTPLKRVSDGHNHSQINDQNHDPIPSLPKRHTLQSEVLEAWEDYLGALETQYKKISRASIIRSGLMGTSDDMVRLSILLINYSIQFTILDDLIASSTPPASL